MNPSEIASKNVIMVVENMGSCLFWVVQLSPGLIQQRSQACQHRALSAAAVKRVYFLWNNISNPFEHLASAYHKCFTIKAFKNNRFSVSKHKSCSIYAKAHHETFYVTITSFLRVQTVCLHSYNDWCFASGSTHSLGRDGQELYHVGMLE